MSNSNENLSYLIEQLIGSIHSMMDFAQYIDTKVTNVRKIASRSKKSEEKPPEQTNSDTPNEASKSEAASSLTTQKDMQEIIRLNNQFEYTKYLNENARQSQPENKTQIQNKRNPESSICTEFSRHPSQSSLDPPKFTFFFDGIQHEDLRRINKEPKEILL